MGEPIGFTGVADRAAIAAARLALDPALDIAVVPGVEVCQQRWGRMGLVDSSGRVVPGKVAALLFRAGRAARLTRRPGAVDFNAGMSAHEIAAQFAESGVDYALTGDAGTNLYHSSAGEAWPVFYVEDVARAAEAAGISRKESGSFGMRVTLIPFDGVSELGRTRIDDIKVVALDQVIVDAYGGIDRMAEQADILLGRRVA
ncbi:hypothetical protein [Nocardioides jensenii]|uniref:hypothetical protein n=1 Tax=Nocardioides jensenii TaxID=1843 RepID=UPI00082D5808|nr:hypothetical protein [Nocardioides jensenii]